MSDLFYDAQDVFDDDTMEMDADVLLDSPVARTLSPVAAWRRLEELREERQLRDRLREFYDD